MHQASRGLAPQGAKFARVSRGSILCQPSLLGDIAQMNADAKVDAAVRRQAGVALNKDVRQLDRAAQQTAIVGREPVSHAGVGNSRPQLCVPTIPRRATSGFAPSR
jgi:hypothetical protein